MSVVVDVSTSGVRTPLSRARIAAVARRALARERVRDALVSITLLDRAAIARLNRAHLGHAGPTDVISFGFARATPRDPVIGDIYIAPQVARGERARARRRRARRVRAPGRSRRAARLGYDHPDGDGREESDMWRRQERHLRAALARRERATHDDDQLWAWILGVARDAARGALRHGGQRAARLPRVRATPARRRSRSPIASARHRALSMGRVISYIVAGASLAQALATSAASPVVRARAVTALAAIVVCTLSEGAGRAVGLLPIAPAVHARLSPMIRFVGAVLQSRRRARRGDRSDAARDHPHAARATKTRRETSAEQFREVVAAEADVSSAEEELIHGVFSLGETEVQEIMVPRVDIVGIEVTTPWSEVLDRIRSSEHARLPVFRETLDEVVGILYAKDVLPSIVADEEPHAGWPSLVRPPSFIPTSKRIDAQLREFQASRSHIAIVSDEYGGTAGLVTIEDILEEIVGEIRDEYDVEEPQIPAGRIRPATGCRDACRVDELSERLNVDFAVDDVTTVGGLVYALFGRVPAPVSRYVHAGFRIVVERVRRRRIERVYFERLEPVHAPEDANDAQRSDHRRAPRRRRG